jgi:hypothetical protein
MFIQSMQRKEIGKCKRDSDIAAPSLPVGLNPPLKLGIANITAAVTSRYDINIELASRMGIVEFDEYCGVPGLFHSEEC